MPQIIAFLAYVGPLLLIALKVGVVIGGTGSLLEELGKWRGWPKVVAFGQKLEAIGADIPKLVGKIEKLIPPASGVAVGLVFALALSVTGCSRLAAVDWSQVASCAERPAEDALTQIVSGVLAGTGDVKTELEGVAEQYGPGVVKCVIAQIVSDLGSAPVTARASRQAERGRAFLAQVQR